MIPHIQHRYRARLVQQLCRAIGFERSSSRHSKTIALSFLLVAIGCAGGCSNSVKDQAAKTWNCGPGAFWVYSVTPTPDERYLILGTAALSTRVWDIDANREVAIIQDYGDV